MADERPATHPEPEPPDDPVYRNARREALVVFAAWLVAGIYTVATCYTFGYERDPQVPTILGMPSWVVWGVALPWLVSVIFGVWFSLFFIRDDDLGEEPED